MNKFYLVCIDKTGRRYAKSKNKGWKLYYRNCPPQSSNCKQFSNKAEALLEKEEFQRQDRIEDEEWQYEIVEVDKNE